MKNQLLASALITMTTVAAAALTNPDAEAHREKYSQAVTGNNAMASALRLGDLAALGTQYHSLRLASYSVLDEKIVTIGAFGLVINWNAQDLS